MTSNKKCILECIHSVCRVYCTNMVRIKNRFIIGQILLPYPTRNAEKVEKLMLSTRDLQKSIREKVAELYGVVGSGEYGQNTVVRFLDSDQSLVFVIRTSREAEIHVRYALSCVTNIREKGNLVLRSLSVNSCPRTCMAALKELLLSYTSKLHEKSEDTLKSSAIEAMEKLLNATEL